jgi:PmbA protein
MEKGVVSSFLYNLKYANIFGVESTGNASRGLSSLPDVDITNLYIKPGNKRPSDILSGISRGIYVMELLGLHTIDPVSGDFSLGIKGILVEKGQMTRPVSGMTIAGNIVEILDLVETVGNDLRFFGNIGGCTLVVNNVSTTGS